MNKSKMTAKVYQSWGEAFPELTKYSQGKIYRIVGPLVIGLEIISRYGEYYMPHFVIYPLWKDSAKNCLDIPMILMNINVRKNHFISIPFDQHLKQFSGVLETFKNEFPLCAEGDIELASILSILDERRFLQPYHAAPNSYLVANLLKSKLETAVICDASKDIIQKMTNEIENTEWDVEHFTLCKVDLDDWLNEVQSVLNNKEGFLKLIDVNLRDKKLQMLNQFNILS